MFTFDTLICKGYMVVLALIGSVFIGSIIGYFTSKNALLPKLLLTFSGAFLLTITVLEIFPTIFTEDHSLNLGLFILIGVFIQIVLEAITKGAEHGHFHFHGKQSFPIAIFVGLFLHAFIEGMPIHFDHDHHLLTAIVIHKIPVALVLYIFISKLTPNISKQLIFMVIFALASPIGWWIGDILMEEFILPILAIVAGIFLHISTVIIFESSDEHKLKFKKLIMLILGFTIAYLSIH